ncbi:MAG: hypothetical protein D6732_26010, partial [Methanobacteriota archaeon]
YRWVPIPKDRDQAFINFEGVILSAVRRANPTWVKFEESYPSVKGLTRNGWEIDRQFLAELEKSTWDSLVSVLQSELTDSVIEKAVQRLPEPYYESIGSFLAKALKSRRNKLPHFATQYYRLITHEPEIQATDEDEFLEIQHADNGVLTVKIYLKHQSAEVYAQPYFERTFFPEETEEVRIYLHGGDDKIEVKGQHPQIAVRIEGGGGDDFYICHSSELGKKTWFYDFRGKNSFEQAKGTKIDTRPFKRPAATGVTVDKYALDWGEQTISFPIFSINPDLGAYGGVVARRRYFGYRKYPFESQHSISVMIASNGVKPLLAYNGLFHHFLSKVDGILNMEYSGLNVIRFHGYGNKTPSPYSDDFYKVEHSEFLFRPGVAYTWKQTTPLAEPSTHKPNQPTFTVGLGVVLRYSTTPLEDNADRFIATFDPPVYGSQTFGQVGVELSFQFDSRDNPGYPAKGWFFNLTGNIYPGIWDVETPFKTLRGEISTYITPHTLASATLAFRAGGKKIWGRFPFHEAAYLGGAEDLRGFWKNRFAGDGSLYGNSELRIPLLKTRFLFPGTLGLLGAYDIGRVYYKNDPGGSGKWHYGIGGGVWWSFLHNREVLSLGIIDGEDLTGVYFRFGLLF